MSIVLKDITSPESVNHIVSVNQIQQGPNISAQARISLYSPNEWEIFIHEWVYYCLSEQFRFVQRLGGNGDFGIDVVGFENDEKLLGNWVNFQCKHYNNPLAPSDIWSEIGKIIWYSYKKEYVFPKNYYFISPKGASSRLSHLLNNEEKLRFELYKNWQKNISHKITQTQNINLDDNLKAYIDSLDLSIFNVKPLLEIIEDYKSTHLYSARFGGGLLPRPLCEPPPKKVAENETLYVTQLYGAYSEFTKQKITNIIELSDEKLIKHFNRQRECFYQAESLRVFARDTVPVGTYDNLKNEIFAGVIDEHDQKHEDGYRKVCAVIKLAATLQITANPLIGCLSVQDRHGICHQLVNEERLRWVK